MIIITQKTRTERRGDSVIVAFPGGRCRMKFLPPPGSWERSRNAAARAGIVFRRGGAPPVGAGRRESSHSSVG